MELRLRQQRMVLLFCRGCWTKKKNALPILGSPGGSSALPRSPSLVIIKITFNFLISFKCPFLADVIWKCKLILGLRSYQRTKVFKSSLVIYFLSTIVDGYRNTVRGYEQGFFVCPFIHLGIAYLI
jgi:hypothetical protein